MDNNKKDRLTDETQKWLDDLLNAPDSQEVGAGELAKQFEKPEEPVSQEEQVIREAEALVADQDTEVDDVDLEKILSEDWLNEDASEDPAPKDPPSQPENDFLLPEEDSEFEEYPTEQPKKATTPKEKAEDGKKQRPKRTDGYGLLGIPHIFSTVIWVALILAIGISIGRVFWVCCADMMAFGKQPQTVSITITSDDTVDSIAQMLSDAGLIRYPKLFKMFVNLTGKDDDIGVGTFTISSQFDYNAMVNAMHSNISRREVVDIMFPEGYNCAQIFKLLEENQVCTAAELEEYAANGELSEYWFLEGVARGSKYCLEGYMAPDTYSLYKGDSPRRVIEKFLDEFESRFTDKMKENFQALQQQYANRLKANGFSVEFVQENTLTLHQVITLASVVQKEIASDSECYDIASVFYNRLVNPSLQFMNSTATLHYALGDYFGEITEFTQEQLDSDSPYNTTKQKGFPPSPICNMGVQALYAALEPNDTDYQYFIYDKNAKAHRFTVTEREYLKYKNELMG